MAQGMPQPAYTASLVGALRGARGVGLKSQGEGAGWWCSRTSRKGARHEKKGTQEVGATRKRRRAEMPQPGYDAAVVVSDIETRGSTE